VILPTNSSKAADLRKFVFYALTQGQYRSAIVAAQAGLDSVVQLLADRGAALETKDKQGRTPLDAALGVGGRGRAGGPAPVHDNTAALIRRLIANRKA
jgi:ankyrin repeat protein